MSKVARKVIVPLQVEPLIVIPTATSSTTNTGTAVDQLASAVENMSLQTEEIKILQAQVNIPQDQTTKTETFHAYKELKTR